MKKDLGELYQPELPPLDRGGAYLVAYLLEVGPVAVAGMGIGAITHEELRDWQYNIGLQLDPWEVRMLKQLSLAYADQLRLATKRDCESPWEAESEKDVTVVARSMKETLEELAKL